MATSPSITTGLFGPPIEPDIFAPRVEPGDCIDGVIARHVETRPIEYTVRGEQRRSRLHTFASHGGEGPRFALFGSVGLDGQLRKLSPGAVVLLQYVGKKPQAGNASKEEHTWTVRQATGNPTQIAALLQVEPWAAVTAAFDRAIARATAADAQRMTARRGGAPGDPEARPFSDDEIAEAAGQ